MCIDTVTVHLLESVLESPKTRRLFTAIADNRIVEKDMRLEGLSETERDSGLRDLENAKLIGIGRSKERFYITAKGIKVARDLSKLCVGPLR